MVFSTAGSSVGRAAGSRSRGPGFETRTGYLVMGSDLTYTVSQKLLEFFKPMLKNKMHER